MSARKEKALCPKEIEKVSKMPCCGKMCTRTLVHKEDILKCHKTYRSLPEEEQHSFLITFFTFSVYEHKGEVHLLLRSIIIVILGLANGGKLSLAVIPHTCSFT